MSDDERSNRDEAYARLEAADPGADVESRPGVLRAKVDARLDGEPAAAPADDPANGLAPRRAPAPARSAGAWRDAAWRRRAFRAAAVAAGVAVVGGGGYTLGVLGQGGGFAADRSVADSAGSAPEAGFLPAGEADELIAAGSAGADDGAASPEGAGDAAAPSLAAPLLGTASAAPGLVEPGLSLPRMTLPAPSFGRTTFSAPGLSEQGGTAQAWALDARGAASAETAARLAQVLGVPGDVRSQERAFAAGSEDGSGPQLWLHADGIGTFWYSDPALSPWMCAEPDADGACPGPPETTVGDDAAAAALADVMRALGVDPGQFEVTVAPLDDGDRTARYVTARRVVGGTATDLAWTATVVDGGLANLHGTLAEVVELGSYDVVSPAQAVARLGDPRFGPGMPVAYAQGASRVPQTAEAEADAGQAPAPPSAGGPIAWPVTHVTITQARLGLTQHWTPQGAVLVLPAYELTDDDGNTWSVVAVADAALDFDTVG